MTDLDNAAAVAAAKEGAGGVSQTEVPTETAQEEVSGAPVSQPAGISWEAITDALPEVVSQLCASVIVPTMRNLLRPTLLNIDRSAADHSDDSVALQSYPERVSTVIQQVGPDHLALLLGAHLTSIAVKAAHAAAADPLESDAPVQMTTPWEIPDITDLPAQEAIAILAPPIGEPIAPPPAETPSVTGL